MTVSLTIRQVSACCAVAVAAVMATALSGCARGEVSEVFAAPVEAAVTEVAQDVSDDAYGFLRDRHNTDFTGVNPEDAREVVCWGDSMTLGSGASPAVIVSGEEPFDASYLSYPAVLQRLCGLKTYNFGVSGASSFELVVMQGDYDLDELALQPDIYDEGIVALGREHPGDILLLEIGSNGGWDSSYSTLIAQYWEMIENSGCSDFLIIGDTDDPGTSYGDTNQQSFAGYEECLEWEANGGLGEADPDGADFGEADPDGEDADENAAQGDDSEEGESQGVGYGEDGAGYGEEGTDEEGFGENDSSDAEELATTLWEDALEAEFGDRFVNTRVYLIENGLTLCGLGPTSLDREFARCGCISRQLRADWTHLNSYGYYAKACAIYERGLELGYWGS